MLEIFDGKGDGEADKKGGEDEKGRALAEGGRTQPVEEKTDGKEGKDILDHILHAEPEMKVRQERALQALKLGFAQGTAQGGRAQVGKGLFPRSPAEIVKRRQPLGDPVRIFSAFAACAVIPGRLPGRKRPGVDRGMVNDAPPRPVRGSFIAHGQIMVFVPVGEAAGNQFAFGGDFAVHVKPLGPLSIGDDQVLPFPGPENGWRFQMGIDSVEIGPGGAEPEGKGGLLLPQRKIPQAGALGIGKNPGGAALINVGGRKIDLHRDPVRFLEGRRQFRRRRGRRKGGAAVGPHAPGGSLDSLMETNRDEIEGPESGEVDEAEIGHEEKAKGWTGKMNQGELRSRRD